MRKKLLIYGILLIFAIISCLEMKAQAPIGRIEYINPLPNGDSVLISRRHSEWWFGAIAGTNLNTYYNVLRLPKNPFIPTNDTLNPNPIYEYSGGGGAGFYLGLIGEWLPPGGDWGADLKILLYDYRMGSTETDPMKLDTLELIYEYKSSFTYITLSQSVRYNLKTPGLHLFAGFDVGFHIKNKSRFWYKFKNSADIHDVRYMPLKDVNIRYAFNFGVGWDFFITDINERFRMDFTPMLSFHLGSPIFSDFNSNWNTLTTRVGLAVKFCPDIVERDTLLFDSTYVVPPVYLASLDMDRGVEFPGFAPGPPISVIIKYRPDMNIMDEISEKPTEARMLSEEIKTVEIMPGKKKEFVYNKARDTDLFSVVEEYLDRIVDYYKSHPGYQVRITGHTDSRGTYLDKTKRANLRADQAKRYLMKRGVPEGRIYARGRADLDPEFSNNTPEGRKKNNRVEIQIVQ